MSGFPFQPGPGARADAAARMASLDGRPLTVLFDLSNKCNIRCRMCYFSYDSVFHRPAVFLPIDRFEQIAAEVFPHAKAVCLSAGSEPLTCPHFIEILRVAAEHDVPYLKFLTNGLLIDDAVTEALIDCGVDEIDVSIDGATRTTYESIRIGGRFDRLCANLTRLRDRKRARASETPLVQFNLTLMRSNVGELDAFVDLALELGAGRIAARHLMPYQGLDMEAESLARTPDLADACFHDFLDRAARASIPVATFPDFFGKVPPSGATSPRPARPAGEAVPRGPFGHIDAPPEESVPGTNAIQFIGWALDHDRVQRVRAEYQLALPAADESIPARSSDAHDRTVIGEATIHNGGRHDLVEAFPNTPYNYRGSWTFELRREMLGLTGPADVTIYFVAESITGITNEIGTRRISYGPHDQAEPFLYCRKPFDSVYFDSEGNAFPYPDCKSLDPFATISKESSFRDIWMNPHFTELRERIIRRDPPEMCLTCPDFINRNVDDAGYFAARPVEHDYRRPVGTLTAAAFASEHGTEFVEICGWALGFDEMRGVEIIRTETVPTETVPTETVPGAANDRLDCDRVSLGWAEFYAGTPDVEPSVRVFANHARALWRIRVPTDLCVGEKQVTLQAVARNRGDERPTNLGEVRLRGRCIEVKPARHDHTAGQAGVRRR